MPNFSDIQKEIGYETVPTAHDIIRKKYLKKLSEKTNRNVILYYSGWLQKPTLRLRKIININDNDKNGFMGAIKGLDTSKGLDIILHTPGGEIGATESLIDYLYEKFDGNIRAIIPQLAMSGGTMIACACKEIIMGKQSSLGPIDPQINGRPASGIIEEFYRAATEIKEDKNKIHVWRHVISNYYPSLIETCTKAVSWSKELASEYLSHSMFHEDLAKNPKDTKKIIDKIIHLLTDQQITKSHSRHISTKVCQSEGLKVKYMETDQELQDIILSIHHAATLTIMNTPAVKIIENQNGESQITTYENTNVTDL